MATNCLNTVFRMLEAVKSNMETVFIIFQKCIQIFEIVFNINDARYNIWILESLDIFWIILNYLEKTPELV